jgi:transposase
MVNPVNSSRECAVCGYTNAANRHKNKFHCKRCQHDSHADVNASEVISARCEDVDALWAQAGGQANLRSKPRMGRRVQERGHRT